VPGGKLAVCLLGYRKRILNASLGTSEGTSILVLQNFHRFLQSGEIVQALSKQIIAGKQNRTILVILAPLVQLPLELERMFVVVEHDLPTREQLQEIAQGVATEDGELPNGVELERVLDASSGLTRYEAENAYSLSLVRHGRVTPEAVWELKSQILRKSGLLQLYRGNEDFRTLGGLSALKAFCKRSLLQPRANTKSKPRGVLLLGVPGTGKSAFAKALGKETGRPTLIFDIGALMGSLVGQTEQNVRQALKIIDAMAPCIAFIDELDKALSGVASSGQTDSGVSARLFGSLLTWMNDHTSDVYLVATCNDISKLPPEFSRAERFDGRQFLSRQGNLFHAPDWFVEMLPAARLDGELWLDRKAFQRTVSIVRRQDKSEHWKELAFLVFDAPTQSGNFEERLAYVRDCVTKCSSKHVQMLEHQQCRGVDHLREELTRVEALGGEGLMLRQPGSLYESLKVKTFHDAEATVIEHLAGAGRHAGRLGALLVQLPDGTQFSVGTGFSDAARENPPALGSTITFRYQELTERGVSRFPSFARVRSDSAKASNVIQPQTPPATLLCSLAYPRQAAPT
jgi:hypothetical protein